LALDVAVLQTIARQARQLINPADQLATDAPVTWSGSPLPSQNFAEPITNTAAPRDGSVQYRQDARDAGYTRDSAARDQPSRHGSAFLTIAPIPRSGK
jgi:hypothetical protein